MTDLDGFGPDDILASADVSRETLDKIVRIIELLDTWRHRTNLIGPREFAHIWRRHVFDSLQLLTHIPKTGTTVDLGAGAGFPGLILAAGLSGTDAQVVMIESVGKKCAFLREAISVADLPASVRNQRVEAVDDVDANCVTARAFAPLPKILDYAEKWLAAGAVGLFPKGRRWQEELTQAEESWKFAYQVIPSASGGDGVILKISEVSRVGHSNTHPGHRQSEGRRR